MGMNEFGNFSPSDQIQQTDRQCSAQFSDYIAHLVFDFRGRGSSDAIRYYVRCLLGFVVRPMAGLDQQQHPSGVNPNPCKLDQRKGIEALRHQFDEQEVRGGHQVQQTGDEAHQNGGAQCHGHAFHGFG